MRRGRLQIAAPLTGSLLLVGFVAFLFWPGSLSPDTFVFMQQAASGSYKMGHPPFLPMFWHSFYGLYDGPEIILLLNLTLFVVGMVLILSGRTYLLSGPVISSIIVIFPPVLGILGAVWLDITMEGLLLCGLGFFLLGLDFHESRRLTLLIQAAGFLMVFAASFVRYNAAAAAIPLLAFMMAANLKIRYRFFVAYAMSFLVCAGLFYVTKTASSEVAEVKRYPEHVIFLFDLAGISVSQGKYLIDERVYPQNSLEDLQKLYHPRSVIPLQLGQQIHGTNVGAHATPFAGVIEADRVNLLFRSWRSAVVTHPISYLEHRLSFFSELIGISGAPAWAPVYYEIVPNAFGIKPRSVPDGYLKWVMSFAEGSILFRPYIYLIGLAALLFAALAFPTKRSGLVVALVLSGYTHMGLLFISAASSDFRYSHWMIVAFCVAAGLRLQDQFAGKATRPGREADGFANGKSA